MPDQTIPKGWRETTLENIAVLISRGIAPSYSEQGLPVINQKCIRDGGVKLALSRITDPSKRSIPDQKYLQTNDILICSTGAGTLGRVGQIKIVDSKLTVDSHVTIVRGGDDISEAFLGWNLKSREREIEYLAEGSTGQTELPRSKLMHLPIFLPPLAEQRAIAAVLSSLDDKIELLREQNKTLEATAQAIFKEWFGKYSPDRPEELPEGWRVGKIGDCVEIRGGTTPSTKNPEFWNGDIAWTSPKDLSNSKETFLLQTEKKITEEGLKQISSGLLPVGTLLLSSRAPIGYLAISDLEIAINQGYIAFLPNQYFSNLFMFLWLKLNMQEVINASNGSTFLEISKSSFRNIQCVIPREDNLKSFDKIIQPLFEKILTNLEQIQSLSALRDTLLPKLMRGEVRVDF